MVSKRKLILLFALGQIGWDIMVLQKSSHCSGNRDIGVNGLSFFFVLQLVPRRASISRNIRQSQRVIDQATYFSAYNRNLCFWTSCIIDSTWFFFFFAIPTCCITLPLGARLLFSWGHARCYGFEWLSVSEYGVLYIYGKEKDVAFSVRRYQQIANYFVK